MVYANRNAAWNLLISGMAEPLGVTALHPIWSADRKAWVAVGELLYLSLAELIS